jgi:phage tail tape-measure protein
VPSEVWRTIFCLIGGGVTGASALMRLVATAAPIRQMTEVRYDLRHHCQSYVE